MLCSFAVTASKSFCMLKELNAISCLICFYFDEFPLHIETNFNLYDWIANSGLTKILSFHCCSVRSK